jgi:hypothetical protein
MFRWHLTHGACQTEESDAGGRLVREHQEGPGSRAIAMIAECITKAVTSNNDSPESR